VRRWRNAVPSCDYAGRCASTVHSTALFRYAFLMPGMADALRPMCTQGTETQVGAQSTNIPNSLPSIKSIRPRATRPQSSNQPEPSSNNHPAPCSCVGRAHSAHWPHRADSAPYQAHHTTRSSIRASHAAWAQTHRPRPQTAPPSDDPHMNGPSHLETVKTSLSRSECRAVAPAPDVER